MIELRWRLGTDKGGAWVLQSRDNGWNWNINEATGEVNSFYNPSKQTEWADVPQVEDKPKEKTLSQKFIEAGLYDGTTSADKLAAIASAHFGGRE